MTKVNLAANQAAEKLSNYETKVDLEEFLTYEDKRINDLKESQAQEPKEIPSPGNFVINDEDEDPE